MKANIQIYNKDCLLAMREMKDNEFDLAIVDPPYGGGQRMNFRFNDDPNKKVYENIRPEKKYFDELFRVSKSIIVWGGNYFTDMLPVSKCWISWYKGQPIDSFSDFELAWTNINYRSRSVKIESYGLNHSDKRNGNIVIHPTQKPIALYKWLLKNYAEPGQRILDTHLGSGSIAIACWDMKFDLVGYEIDEDYYKAAIKRFENHKAQLQLDL